MLLLFLFNLILSDPFGIDPALSLDYSLAINKINNSFTCLDQSMTIPLSSLNDGKCDCPDGSDEPGTSACLNGHFYCRNIGGRAKTIPSHKVNDGICDCCDGSDEFGNPNHQCTNICSKLVEMSHNSRDLIYSKIQSGIKIKEESIKQTQSDFQQAQKEMRDLHQDLSKMEHEIDALNRIKREKYKLWKIEKRQQEGISEEMYAELKRRKKEYIYKPPKEKPVYNEPDPHGLNIYFEKEGYDWDAKEDIEDYFFYTTPRPNPSKNNQIDPERIRKRTQKWNEIQNAENEHKLNTKETLSFIERARIKIKEIASKAFGTDQPESYKKYKEVEKEIQDLNNDISTVRVAIYKFDQKFKHNFGEDNVWWPIASQSFELSKDGNDYQLTIFEHILQRQTGSHWFGTSYGTFQGFNSTNRTMYYEEGQLCWEGPPRRTEVVLYCGSIHKFIDIEEIDRCVFKAHFETPLCCNEGYIEWIKNMSDLELSEYISKWIEVE